MTNPAARYLFDRWGPVLTKTAFRIELDRALEKRIRAQVELGFDSVWAILDETFTVVDHATMVRFSGSIFNLQPDGYGNMTYMYRGPGIKTRRISRTGHTGPMRTTWRTARTGSSER